MSTLFEAEVREQPVVLARLLARGRERTEAAAARVRAHGARFVVLAARGSSDNAARYGQYLLGIHNRLVASLATPSLFTQYHAAPALHDSLVVGISQSGCSPDVIAVVREARRQGAATLAITNDEDSPLARAAEAVVPLLAGAERAVAASKTYTAELLALAMLSAALREQAQPWADLAALPEQVAHTLELSAEAVRLARDFRDHARLLVVARGYNLATAIEICLKVEETSGVMADGYSSADFLHGPRALLDHSLPVLMIAPGPRVFEDLDEVARMAADKGAPLVAISDRPEILGAARVALPLPAGVPEWLSPLVAVVPGQLWALGLSLARGREPDAPAGLSKVTRTR